MTETVQPCLEYYQPGIETISRDELQLLQWQYLKNMLNVLFTHNPFYQAKWWSAGVRDAMDIETLEDFQSLPFTSRQELSIDQSQYPPYGTNLTWPLEQYVKWFRTSGTQGKPLNVLLTARDWAITAESWCYGATGVGLHPGDTIFIPFSFGPFIGFWTTEAGARLGGLRSMPGGGMNTVQRLELIMQYHPKAISCLPSYALRMAEVAREEGYDIRSAGVQVLIMGGEPGPCLPSIRNRIEQSWNAHAYDAYGMTEAGRIAHECIVQSGMHLVENMLLVEVLEPGGTKPVPEGEIGELVLTTLLRTGMPIIRYRTHDLVRLTTERCVCGRTSARLIGGVLGRTDGMVVVRGINIYPTAIDDCLMSYPEIAEYQVEIFEERGMKEIKIRLELCSTFQDRKNGHSFAERVAQDLHCRLGLRLEVETLPPGSLPRWEGKAKRFVQRANEPANLLSGNI